MTQQCLLPPKQCSVWMRQLHTSRCTLAAARPGTLLWKTWCEAFAAHQKTLSVAHMRCSLKSRQSGVWHRKVLAVLQNSV